MAGVSVDPPSRNSAMVEKLDLPLPLLSDPRGDFIKRLGLWNDEEGVSEAGREQPPVEPEVETVDAPVADAPDSTTQKQMHEDPTKLEQSGEPAAEKKRGRGTGAKPKSKPKKDTKSS